MVGSFSSSCSRLRGQGAVLWGSQLGGRRESRCHTETRKEDRTETGPQGQPHRPLLRGPLGDLNPLPPPGFPGSTPRTGWDPPLPIAVKVPLRHGSPQNPAKRRAGARKRPLPAAGLGGGGGQALHAPPPQEPSPIQKAGQVPGQDFHSNLASGPFPHPQRGPSSAQGFPAWSLGFHPRGDPPAGPPGAGSRQAPPLHPAATAVGDPQSQGDPYAQGPRENTSPPSPPSTPSLFAKLQPRRAPLRAQAPE